MLSAFTARPIVELRQRDKSKIESIHTYGDRLLAGLNTGSLRIYRVNDISADQPGHKRTSSIDKKPSSRPSSSSTPKAADLLRDEEKFSTRAIEQLAIIKEANILISLSNSYVSLHDLQTYTLQEQLAKTKNATTFAVTSNIVKDPSTGIPEIISRLAVAVKRRLLLWSWHDSELLPDVIDITLTASIRTLTWATATKIICGMNSGYVIADVESQETEDIVGPGAIGGSAGAEASRFGGVGSASMGYMGLGGYVPKPLATRLGAGEMLLAKDINSLFIDTDGKPQEKRQVPWQQAPESIGYTYPYMVSLQSVSKGALEVRNPETLMLLQTISLPNASQLHFPPPTVSLAHAGKGFHVVSDRVIWRMGATDYNTQIDELVDKAQFDEAISVLGMLEDALVTNKDERLREVKMLKAQRFFDQRKYFDATDLFTEVAAPPERVIRLYPKIIAGDLSDLDEKVEEELKHENGEGAANGNGELKVPEDPAPEAIVGSPKPGALSMFMRQNKTIPPTSDAGSIKSSKHEASDTASIKAKPAEDVPLEGKDLTNAINALVGFLVDTRTRLQRFLDPTTGKLKSVTENGQNGTSQQAFESLLMKPSATADLDRERKLQDTAKLVDTTIFRAYMLVRPSLVGSLVRLPNFCDPDVVNSKLLEKKKYVDLVDFFHTKKLHRPALELLKEFGQAKEANEEAPNLHGPERTAGYLQNLPPELIDLILEFAEWPLRANPDLGMEIFLADTENAETLPRDKVLDFLQNIDIDLAVRYLEHLINELNDATPDFHNRLASSYVQDLKNRNDRDERSWQDLMERLLSFLRSSKQYSLSKAFGWIPRDDSYFYEAQAVVLSALGQHKQALEIYVFKLKNYEKAEEYCNRVHLSQSSPSSSPLQSRRTSTSEPDDAPPSIYHTLLSLYLTPPAPHKPNWEPALSLLSRHGARLPAASTLNLIPNDLPVAELESYFRGRIRSANSIVNESRIEAMLLKTEVVAAQAALLIGDGMASANGGRNRNVVVTEERVCGVCHKRLGGSVVAVLPDNSVVHYGCLNRVGQGRSSSREPKRWGP